MMEHKIDMNIDKYKKQNMAEHKADLNKNTNAKKTDHDRAQNRYEHY